MNIILLDNTNKSVVGNINGNKQTVVYLDAILYQKVRDCKEYMAVIKYVYNMYKNDDKKVVVQYIQSGEEGQVGVAFYNEETKKFDIEKAIIQEDLLNIVNTALEKITILVKDYLHSKGVECE